MKKLILLTALLCSASFAATAQPIESEPLKPFVPYTLQGETDPMALDSSAASSSAPVAAPSGDFAPLTPADHVPAQEIAPINTDPVVQDNPAPLKPVDGFPPAPSASSASPSYDNNTVTGVPIKDTSKFEKRIFCTLKVTFRTVGGKTDAPTETAVKTYLDANADKLTYINAKEGSSNAYCVTVAEHNNKATVYSSVKRLLPPKGGMTPEVLLSGKGFTPVTSGRKAL